MNELSPLERNPRTLKSRLDAFVALCARFYGRRLPMSVVMVGAASVLCVALLVVRISYTDSIQYRFMVWNLFLAWIPFLAALRLYTLRDRTRTGALVLGGLWLLFFPNAPYIVTDLIHLRWHDAAPLWFDVVMVGAFAWTGLILGIISLRLVQSLVRQRFGNIVSWLFVLTALTAAGFGIYLGRFQRWNSWDVVTNPRGLGTDLVHMLLDPVVLKHTFGVTMLFTAFLVVVYVMVTALPALQGERGER